MDIIEKLGITPGPWGTEQTESVETGLDILINDHSKMRPVAWCYLIEDARLTSASPELLEVVIELMACSEYWSEYYVPLGIHDRIKNAVEKATGRTADKIMEMYNE